jgi:hypothetical protein
VTQLTALLHDIADWKFHCGDENISPQIARKWLEKMNVKENVVSPVYKI